MDIIIYSHANKTHLYRVVHLAYFENEGFWNSEVAYSKAKKALMDFQDSKETGALLVFKDQKANVLFLPKYLFLQNLSMCFLTSWQLFIVGFKVNRLRK